MSRQQNAPEQEKKVLYIRRKYHLGPIRIVWYLERYHGMKISDATVSRILRRHGLNRLPRGSLLFNFIRFVCKFIELLAIGCKFVAR